MFVEREFSDRIWLKPSLAKPNKNVFLSIISSASGAYDVLALKHILSILESILSVIWPDHFVRIPARIKNNRKTLNI